MNKRPKRAQNGENRENKRINAFIGLRRADLAGNYSWPGRTTHLDPPLRQVTLVARQPDPPQRRGWRTCKYCIRLQTANPPSPTWAVSTTCGVHFAKFFICPLMCQSFFYIAEGVSRNNNTNGHWTGCPVTPELEPVLALLGCKWLWTTTPLMIAYGRMGGMRPKWNKMGKGP